MAMDRCEFGSSELRIVGGDYGQIVLEGTTAAARNALDKVTSHARSRGHGVDVGLLVNVEDPTPPVVEVRHAGVEAERYFAAGADAPEPDATGKKSLAPKGHR